jgi:hypothetical protein
MRTRQLVIALSSLALVTAGGLALAPAASAATTVVVTGTVDGTSTDISGGYPLDHCEWRTWLGTDPARGNLLPFTPNESGNATFTVSDYSWNVGAAVAIFETSVSEANCLESTLPDAPLSPSVSVPVLRGHQYVVLVHGCSDACDGGTYDYGTYTLTITVTPPPAMWLKSVGRASATDSCADGSNPSWAMWPNGGTGGYVCDTSVPA